MKYAETHRNTVCGAVEGKTMGTEQQHEDKATRGQYRGLKNPFCSKDSSKAVHLLRYKTSDFSHLF